MEEKNKIDHNQKVYKLVTHILIQNKKCTKATICILGLQQYPQWPPLVWGVVISIFRPNAYSVGGTKWHPIFLHCQLGLPCWIIQISTMKIYWVQSIQRPGFQISSRKQNNFFFSLIMLYLRKLQTFFHNYLAYL